MKTYSVKLEVNAEVQAFSEEDAADYINDIFGVCLLYTSDAADE